MIEDCLGQCAINAANISFNLEGLRSGFWELTIDGLAWGAIYALVAVGYTLVFGVLRLINFAHSEIFMLGMFGAYFTLEMVLGFTPSGNAYSMGIFLTVAYLGIAMLVAMVVSGTAAMGLEAVAYRPLRKRNAKPLAFLITAIGMSFVLQEFVHFVLPQLVRGYGGSNAQQPIVLVVPKTQFTVFGATVSNVMLVIVAAACFFALVVDRAINRTKFGRGIRAVAQDPTTATLMGVSRERIIILTFLIGGLLAGAAALVSLAWLGSGRPNIGQNLELTSLTAATLGGVSIFGGKGGVAGVLAAVLLLVTLQTALLQLNVNSIWQVGIVGILLIIVLLIDRLSTPRR